MRPDTSVVQNVSDSLSATALSDGEKTYAIYLHVPLPPKPKNLAEHLRKDITAQSGPAITRWRL